MVFGPLICRNFSTICAENGSERNLKFRFILDNRERYAEEMTITICKKYERVYGKKRFHIHLDTSNFNFTYYVIFLYADSIVIELPSPLGSNSIIIFLYGLVQ